MLKFGIFDHLEQRPEIDLARQYEERFLLMEQADAGDFYCWLTAEHHHSPLCMAPNQSVFLAAAAKRTRKLRIGTLVFVLPLHHPIRLLEEICMMDQISDGRFQVGVGKGASGREAQMWGEGADEGAERFEESLQIILQGLQTNFLSFKGKFFEFENLFMALKPHQKPHPPFWYAENPVNAGRRGMNFVCHGSIAQLIPKIKAYRTSLAESKPAWENGVAHLSDPLYGATRRLYIADTDAEALERARESYEVYRSHYAKPLPSEYDAAGNRLPDLPFRIGTAGPPSITFETGLAEETIVIGSPSTARDHVIRYIRESGANYYGTAFQWGDLTHAEASHSMKLFVDEVMPVAHSLDAAKTTARSSAKPV